MQRAAIHPLMADWVAERSFSGHSLLGRVLTSNDFSIHNYFEFFKGYLGQGACGYVDLRLLGKTKRAPRLGSIYMELNHRPIRNEWGACFQPFHPICVAQRRI